MVQKESEVHLLRHNEFITNTIKRKELAKRRGMVRKPNLRMSNIILFF